MATWFTSDLHINHRLVAGIRGFLMEGLDETPVPDLTGHSGAIKKAWSVVKPDDVVWVLGDLCVSNRTWPDALALIKGLPGRKRLVSGNHDPVSSIHREAWKHQRAAMEVFETVQDFAKVRLGGRIVLLSHYPYGGVGSEGLRGEDGTQVTERYTEFRLTDRGTPLLHGHTHGPERLHFSEYGTPQVHVGLDAWNMKLVPQHEVEKLLDTSDSSVNVES